MAVLPSHVWMRWEAALSASTIAAAHKIVKVLLRGWRVSFYSTRHWVGACSSFGLCHPLTRVQQPTLPLSQTETPPNRTFECFPSSFAPYLHSFFFFFSKKELQVVFWSKGRDERARTTAFRSNEYQVDIATEQRTSRGIIALATVDNYLIKLYIRTKSSVSTAHGLTVSGRCILHERS